MRSYRTEYPNQVHLLAVSVSKHWWIGKDGTLKYQKRPFEVTLRTLPSSGKAHCVVFGLRDHCSGILYCDIASSDEIPSLADFLYHAWSPKSGLSFRGMPELLGVPKTVQAVFPGSANAVESLGVSLVPITSGFQGGAGMTKPVEQWIAFDLGKPFESALTRVAQLPAFLANEICRPGNRTKLDIWQHGVPDRLLDGPPVDWLNTARNQTRIVLRGPVTE